MHPLLPEIGSRSLLFPGTRLQIGPFSFTAASAAVAPGRISFAFGFSGPSAAVDTACSASLVACHAAATELRAGRCGGGAVVAGVMLQLVPQSALMVVRAGMAAADGRCKVMDATADGYVRGEACRALWLGPYRRGGAAPASPLPEAGGGRASILALVAATAVNSNASSSSLTAPHGPSQCALLQAALHEAGLSPGTVIGLQMHANGGCWVAGEMLCTTAFGRPSCDGCNIPVKKASPTQRGKVVHEGRGRLAQPPMTPRRVHTSTIPVYPTTYTPPPAGTPLGDPIEVGAAASVYFPATTAGGNARQPGSECTAWDDGSRPFAWSTIKGYGGHQEAAAGGWLQVGPELSAVCECVWGSHQATPGQGLLIHREVPVGGVRAGGELNPTTQVLQGDGNGGASKSQCTLHVHV